MQSSLKSEGDRSRLLFPPLRDLHGDVTRRRLSRLGRAYAVLAACGTAVQLIGPADWAGFGLGLMAPGAGFTSGWLAIASVVAFAASVVLWFGTGSAILPPVVWIGAALLSAVTDPPGLVQRLAVPGVVSVGLAALWLWQGRKLRRGQELRAAANTYLATRADFPPPPPPSDELHPDDIARLRLLLDRALQPVADFEGFEWRDQFQTAAIRYQINFISYALTMVQARYTPAFKGYLHTAQDRLLAKQQDTRVWRYWALENLWGNGRIDPDPVRRENIMYSGFVAAQIALRANACAYPLGDTPAGLHGRFMGRCHDYSDFEIIDLLTHQYEASDFGLLSCEPNWIYPLCNLITATAIRGHAARHGTDHWDRIAQRFYACLDAEFTHADGRLVPFRSAYTGIAPPAVGGLVMQSFPCLFLNAIRPQMAERQWHAMRLGMQGRATRRAIWPVDVGNYGLSRAAGYTATAAAAREIGDSDMAQQMLDLLDADCTVVTVAGVSHRENALLWALANEVLARSTVQNGLHRVATTPQAADAPYLDSAEGWVAKARSAPDQLDAVLYPRHSSAPHEITIAGLRPRQRYILRLPVTQHLTADGAGRITTSVPMSGRTSLILRRQV